ncbi:MAG: hypothetical protein HC915_06905 [Anaerolineae bacterium]|nr:hypothetical protein [Anaerolineae bacterium]
MPAIDTYLDIWTARKGHWEMDCTVGHTADLYHLLPNVLRATCCLAEDPAVPTKVRPQLETLLNKTIKGVEYLPDDYTGVLALVSDGVRLAHGLAPLLPEIPTEAQAAAWPLADLTLAEAVDGMLAYRERFAPECVYPRS